MPKIRMHDLVILLPGITGSVLRKDGRDIWAASGQALWSALKSLGGSLQDLALPIHDPSGDPPDTALVASGLMEGFHGIFGLWRIDGYDITAKTIVEGFDIESGTPLDGNDRANLISFPYDWRLSNRVSARRLKAFIDRRLPAFRKATDNPGAKVILLAHSMGGLVSRYYLEVLEGWRTCKALITFGTPYRGAVESLNYLANGYPKSALGDLTEVLRGLPSVYELIPRYEALKVGNEWKRPAEAGALLGLHGPYTQAALAFHLEIDAAIAVNRREATYMEKPYAVFPVVGVRQPTLNSAVLEGGKIVASELRPEWLDAELSGGDGTVPRVSATPLDREQDLREIFFAERHASLQRNDHVLTDLVERLKQMQAPRHRPARGGIAVAPRTMGLRIEQLYLTTEPVELSVEAEDIEPFGAPRARIVGTASELPEREARFVRSGDRWTANFGTLPPGQYRVRVEPGRGGPGAPSPVHDVFEVAT